MQRAFIYDVLLKAGTNSATVHIDMNYSYLSDSATSFDASFDMDNVPFTNADFGSAPKVAKKLTDLVQAQLSSSYSITVSSNEVIVENFSFGH